MTPDFWRLVDLARPGKLDPGAHASALTTRLVKAGIDVTRGFAESFDKAMDALYTWDLWGAASLALGGCSDDLFQYVRAWIIGSGDVSWSLAFSDPESLFIRLIDGSSDPESKWEALRLHEGESLLYVAGTAHQQLTGEWPTSRYCPHPNAPEGEEWAEAFLPHLYPDLAAALPADWWKGPVLDEAHLAVIRDVERGLSLFVEGDHTRAAEALEHVIEDPDSWRLCPRARIGDVAYAVGIGRLLRGEAESAVDALRMAADSIESEPHLRRALAQAEMAIGDLDDAEGHVDLTQDADPLDRVLAAKLAWRKGDFEAALQRAQIELDSPDSEDDHPWDVAGRLHQLGQLFVESGAPEAAQRAVDRLEPYLEEAPEDLPLRAHVDLLKASVLRLNRPEEALPVLEALRRRLQGTDRAECMRELARCQRSLGSDEAAALSYRASVEGFEITGERWEALNTAEEGGL